MHAHGELRPTIDQLGNGEKLDGVPEPAGVGDVRGADPTDALAVYVRIDDVTPERERGQYRRLGRGIVALDVGRGVALGHAELLGLAQHIVVAGTLLLHAGEDVVRRAVHDSHDADDLLTRQGLTQRPDDGDRPRHGGFVEEVDTRPVGDLGQLGTGHGQQCLVGGDHRLAVTQGRLDQLVGGVQPPDDLHDDIDVGPSHESGGVRPDEIGGDGRRPGPCRVGDGNGDELQTDARAGGDVLGAGEEDFGQGAADVAAAEQADADGRGLMGVREGAGRVRGHHQTVQGAALRTAHARRRQSEGSLEHASAQWC